MMTRSLTIYSIIAPIVLATLAAPAEALPHNALQVDISRVYVAAPGETNSDPSMISWIVYDAFPGSSLDTNLWEASEGAISFGAAGATLTPAVLSTPGHTNAGIRAAAPILFGGYFAFRIPFSIQTVTADLRGVADFNVDICSPHQQTQCVSIGWVLANNISPPTGGPVLSGEFFHEEDGSGAFNSFPTTVSTGQFAMTYSGGLIRSYFDDGSGWRQLGSHYSPPIDWMPMRFELDAGVTVLPPSPVPEPTTWSLLGLGILSVAVALHRTRALV